MNELTKQGIIINTTTFKNNIPAYSLQEVRYFMSVWTKTISASN
jgi:hypothetical protein